MLDQYAQRIGSFHKMQIRLLAKLTPMLHFKPAHVAGHSFSPIHQHSIQAQIGSWPTDTYLLPLGSWIEPRRGVVEVDGDVWQFALHGTQDISFIQEGTNQDVTVTISSHGDIGLTEWSMRIFLETSRAVPLETAAELNKQHFARLVEAGFLVSVPPRPLFDDAVFVLSQEAGILG